MGNSASCCRSPCCDERGGALEYEQVGAQDRAGFLDAGKESSLRTKTDGFYPRMEKLRSNHKDECEKLKAEQEKSNSKTPVKTKDGYIMVKRKHDTGTEYHGFMMGGSKQGFGKYIYAEDGYQGQRSFYEGEWKENRAHGFGMFQDSAGEYVGNWTSGEKHGLGMEKWFEDGTVFRGNYVNGFKEGEGLYEWSDGSSYEGQLSDNHITGEGKLVDDEGIYIGQFFENAQHGEGKWMYVNGDFYVGQFEDSLRHGHGTLKWVKENKQYSGQWCKGVPHGEGTVTIRSVDRPAYYIHGKTCTKEALDEHKAEEGTNSKEGGKADDGGKKAEGSSTVEHRPSKYY